MKKNDQEKKHLLFRVIGYGVFTLLIAVFSYNLGIQAEKTANSSLEGEVLHVEQKTPSYVQEDVDFALFWEVWKMVEDSYVDQPVSEKDLFYGALEGMLASLDDPYSVFFTPELAASFEADLDGTFFGIGAEIGERDGGIMVIAPLGGSPAEKAGVQAGDYITAVDGNSTVDFDVNEAVMKIRGEKGTPVVLQVYREGEDELLDIEIIRDEITLDSVEWELREDGIAVIDVYMFNQDTTRLFEQAVQEILTQDVKGIILDVRNNPGGLLTEAINLVGYWVENSPAVIEKIGDSEQVFSTHGQAELAGMPTVVLVNQGSASGSEILAGALQDYEVATLIGETTFGKGSVQEYHDFSDGSALKVTIAEWLTPNKRSINKIGIEPDISVEFTSEDYHEGKTPQFDAAIDFLQAQ